MHQDVESVRVHLGLLDEAVNLAHRLLVQLDHVLLHLLQGQALLVQTQFMENTWKPTGKSDRGHNTRRIQLHYFQ